MKIKQVENYMAGEMMKQTLKKTMGDGYEFELVYEALNQTGALDNLLGTAEEDEQKQASSFKSGLTVDSMPMTLRTAPIVSGEIYLNETINKSLDGSSSSDSLISQTDSVKDVPLSNNSDSYLDEIYLAVDKYSVKYGVDKNLILSIIKQESGFNKDATSHAGAKGLMQLMDMNSEHYGLTDPYDIEQNIEAGVKHIKTYLNNYNEDLEMALMAYNGGPGTMERRGVKDSSYLYRMPSETQSYVPAVLAHYENYKNS